MKKRKILYKKLIAFIVLALLLLSLAIFGLFKAFNYVSSLIYPPEDKPVYYLAVGMDDQENSAADAIMVVADMKKEKQLCIISLPPNTRIGHEKDKIMTLSDAFVEGGLEETKSEVENLMHIHIDQEAAIDYSSFNEMMNKAGPVSLYVEQPMKHVDSSGDTDIDLRLGYQTLEGAQILDYFRYYDAESGEIGRIQRDERLMKAVLQKEQHNLAIMNWLAARRCWKAFETNITPSQMASLCYEITDYPENQIHFIILPGETQKIGNKTVWDSNPVEIQKTIAITLGQSDTQ